MEAIEIAAALARVAPLSERLSAWRWHRDATYEVGLVTFSPPGDPAAPLVVHHDRDVIAQPLSGCGVLRLADERTPVRPGALYRIPAGTAHAFAPSGDEPLALLYLLIRVEEDV